LISLVTFGAHPQRCDTWSCAVDHWTGLRAASGTYAGDARPSNRHSAQHPIVTHAAISPPSTRPHPRSTIDTNSFPNTVANFYWSTTPDASDAGNSWHLGFAHGFEYSYRKEHATHLHLARGGAPTKAARAAIDNGSAVREVENGLICNAAVSDNDGMATPLASHRHLQWYVNFM